MLLDVHWSDDRKVIDLVGEALPADGADHDTSRWEDDGGAASHIEPLEDECSA